MAEDTQRLVRREARSPRSAAAGILFIVISLVVGWLLGGWFATSSVFNSSNRGHKSGARHE
jgi:hypothetical protein